MSAGAGLRRRMRRRGLVGRGDDGTRPLAGQPVAGRLVGHGDLDGDAHGAHVQGRHVQGGIAGHRAIVSASPKVRTWT